jgi:CubicO group peptidase (beta-lactamase class C family)
MIPRNLMRFTARLLFISLVALTATKASAQSADPKLNGFDQFVNQQIKEWKVPGLAIAIVKDGKVIHAQGYGFRDVKKNLPVTADTLFAIGSCTKAFTATTMGILVDDAKLDWDKPVRDSIPSFKMQDDYVTANMTPRDLVTHRSGLPRHDLVWYGAPLSRKELFDRLRYLEPSKPFRTTFQYQNLMFMAAGYLVGEVAGTSWEEFTRKKILDPIGMKTSNFSVTASQKMADFALPYQEEKDEIKEVPFRNIDAVGPAGNINSSVAEMANWVMLNLSKGKLNGKPVISQTALQQIHTPHTVTPGPLKYDETSYGSYAMGWSVNSYRGHTMLAHGGGIDGFTAHVSFMPRDNIGLVILTNKGGTPLPSVIAYNVYDRLLGMSEVAWSQRLKDEIAKGKEAAEKAKNEKDPNRKMGTQPSHAIKEYAGKFEHPAYGVVTIEQAGERLKGDIHGLPFTLAHYHYDVFEVPDEQFSKLKFNFLANVKGEIDRVSIPIETGVKEIVFTRMFDAGLLDAAMLEKFAGEYLLAGVSVKVGLRADKTLVASVPSQPDYELVPKKGTEFALKGMAGFSIEFKVDTSGAVTEAVITQPNGVFTAKRK